MDDELRRQARAWAERTAMEQGLPAKIEDVATIRQVLVLMGVFDAEGDPVKPLK